MKEKSFVGKYKYTIIGLIIWLIIVQVIKAFFVVPLQVDGNAMSKTLNDGDRIFAIRRFDKIERGDIVVFYYPKKTSISIVERVIGLPGETIESKDGQLLINGVELKEPYLPANNTFTLIDEKISIPQNHYFVLGDNRIDSFDSRKFGLLPKDLIYGKFYSRYWSASS